MLTARWNLSLSLKRVIYHVKNEVHRNGTLELCAVYEDGRSMCNAEFLPHSDTSLFLCEVLLLDTGLELFFVDMKSASLRECLCINFLFCQSQLAFCAAVLSCVLMDAVYSGPIRIGA